MSLRWNRSNLNEPITERALQSLQPGESDLTQCLAALGAPNIVWEYKIDGMAMAYAYHDIGGWGFSVSYSPADYAPSASFSWDSDAALFNGVVLMFDEDLTLRDLKRGFLGDLVPSVSRPAPLPEDIRGDD